jgi:predicted SprT family Zn-dependent metalloprotease
MTTAYCFRCKANKAIVKPKRVAMKNGKDAETGPCATCGGKLFRIVGKKAA